MMLTAVWNWYGFPLIDIIPMGSIFNAQDDIPHIRPPFSKFFTTIKISDGDVL
jgi:hypothetical protein